MRSGLVIGVLAGCGGAGASTFAAVLAAVMAQGPRASSVRGQPVQDDGAVFLLDCDSLGGGIDVLLGCEAVPGPRWSQVRLAGGELSAAALHADLPKWGQVSFLAADTAADLAPPAITQLTQAARASGSVVIDIPRCSGPVRQAAIALCDLSVIITPAEVRSVTSAAMAAASLQQRRTVLVVRGSSTALPASRVSEVLGVELIGELPYDTAGLGSHGLDLRRVRKRTRRVAEAVIGRAARELALT